MRRLPRFMVPSFATALALTSGTAFAQAPPAPVQGTGIAPAAAPAAAPAPTGAAQVIAGVTPALVDKPTFDDGDRPQGWVNRIATTATFSFANNSNVVGQLDGSSIAFGFKFDSNFNYNHEKHEWRTSVNALGAITRTPLIDAFIKTSDGLNFDSTYLYHAFKIFGPFVRIAYQTSMFRGTDERALPTDYFVQATPTQPAAGIMPTGGPGALPRCPTSGIPTVNCVVPGANSFELSDPFKPSTFKQSVGVFLQPYASEPFSIEFRGGAGGQEVLANGQYALQPSPPPGTNPNGSQMYFDVYRVDVKELSDVNQLGAELAASIWGDFVAKKITYKFNIDAMTPFAHTSLPAGDTRTAFDLTNLQIDGAVSVHIVDWATLDYNLRVIRQPQVVDAYQVQNTLVLNFGQTWTNAPPPPPPPPAPPAAPPPPAH